MKTGKSLAELKSQEIIDYFGDKCEKSEEILALRNCIYPGKGKDHRVNEAGALALVSGWNNLWYCGRVDDLELGGPSGPRDWKQCEYCQKDQWHNPPPHTPVKDRLGTFWPAIEADWKKRRPRPYNEDGKPIFEGTKKLNALAG